MLRIARCYNNNEFSHCLIHLSFYSRILWWHEKVLYSYICMHMCVSVCVNLLIYLDLILITDSLNIPGYTEQFESGWGDIYLESVNLCKEDPFEFLRKYHFFLDIYLEAEN